MMMCNQQKQSKIKKRVKGLKTMTQIINLTPHIVSIVNQANEIIGEYPLSGIEARLSSTAEVIGEVDGITISKTVYGDAVNLPEPAENTLYIVSTIVAQGVPQRKDLIVPDSGRTALRYTDGPDKGKVIGVRGFIQY
jgi:hypothetical protein